jgi:hypothetical protein
MRKPGGEERKMSSLKFKFMMEGEGNLRKFPIHFIIRL